MQRLPTYNHANMVFLVPNVPFSDVNAEPPTMNYGSKLIRPEGHQNNLGGTQAFSSNQPVWIPNTPNIHYQILNPNMQYPNNFQIIPINGCHAQPAHIPQTLQHMQQQRMQQCYMPPPLQPFMQQMPPKNVNFLEENSPAPPHIYNSNNTYGVAPPPFHNSLEREFYSSSDSDSNSMSPPQECSPTHQRTTDHNDMVDLKSVISPMESEMNPVEVEKNHTANVRNVGHVTLLQNEFIKFLEQNCKSLDVKNVEKVKHQELVYLALNGCNIAEELANQHRRRPCFKKIDHLCERLKQDITRPNNVISNINSQGSIWAVKDFIFAFTRIFNAWVIIKGYVNNNHKGLNNIKSEFSDDLYASFAAWQNTTLVLGANLIKTFMNLNAFVHSQKASLSLIPKICNKSGMIETSNLRIRSMRTKYYIPYSMKKEYFISNTPNEGDYLKTGTYKPIQNTPNHNSSTTCDEGAQLISNKNSDDNENDEHQLPGKPAITTRNLQGSEPVFDDQVQNNCVEKSTITLQERVNFDRINQVQIPTQQCSNNGFASMNININSDIRYNLNRVPLCTSTPIKLPSAKENFPPSWLNYDLRVLVKTASVHSKNFDGRVPQKKFDELFIRHLNLMITSLMSMQNAQYFFDVRKTQLYFPHFCTMFRKEFVDIRTIILKCQAGMYTNMTQVIIDVQNIPYLVRLYSRNIENPALIRNASMFEMEFNTILGKPPFSSY